MQVDCPECGASQAGSPGAEVVCPACMTPFLVPALARAVRAFDVQAAGDAVAHGMSRHAIREAIYVGRLDASARVRHEGGKWELIGGYPEFAAVFRLLGGDLAPMAGTRKLAGWGRGPDIRERSAARAPTSNGLAGDGRRTRSDTLDEANGLSGAAPTSRASATRSPTLVPPPSKNAPPPPLPAATAPRAAAVAAAVADTESLAPAPRSDTRPPARPVEAAPARVPWAAIGAGAVLLVLAAWWFSG